MLKTTDQFVADENGKFIEEIDTKALNQCKDLIQRYVKVVLGLIYLPLGNACTVFAMAQSDLYEKIIYYVGFIPTKGDIAVWGIRYGKYGHVGVVLSANLLYMTVFEQNDPLYSPCHIKRYSYFGLIGFLRKKGMATDEEFIKSLYRMVWKREPAYGDWYYFKVRLLAKSITAKTLQSTVEWTYGQYLNRGNDWWQKEKGKWI